MHITLTYMCKNLLIYGAISKLITTTPVHEYRIYLLEFCWRWWISCHFIVLNVAVFSSI